MTGILLAIALSAHPVTGGQQRTVSIVVAPDKPAIEVFYKGAEVMFETLCVKGTKDEMLRPLAAALNPMPNWPQMVMNGDASVCQRNPKPLPVVSVGTPWP